MLVRANDSGYPVVLILFIIIWISTAPLLCDYLGMLLGDHNKIQTGL